MPWTRINDIDNLQKKMDQLNKPKSNSVEAKHKKKKEDELRKKHIEDRFTVDIIKIIHHK